jgi:hypothetical protein
MASGDIREPDEGASSFAQNRDCAPSPDLLRAVRSQIVLSPHAGRGKDASLQREKTLTVALEQPLHFDMDALAGRRAMTFARGEKRARLFGARGLDEPFLGARDHDGGVEGAPARRRFGLRSRLRP